MNLIQAIIMGIVQGLTEFLPVSSSGHLVITASLYKYFTNSTLTLGGPEEIFFDIMVHIATLIAIFIYFWPELSAIFSPKNIIEHLKLYKIRSVKTIKEDLTNNYQTLSLNNKLLFFLGIATTATVCIAFPLKDVARNLTQQPLFACIMLLITSSLLFVSHYISEKKKAKLPEVNFSTAIIMGLAQGFAILPGISRSGSTIAFGLMKGLDRVTAAKFSFILSSPIIILAALHEGLDFALNGHINNFHWLSIFVGTVVAGLTGYLCIKYFIRFLSKYSLLAFAYYCLIVGIALGIFFFMTGPIS